MMKMRGIFCCVVIVLEYFNVSPWQWQAVAANNMRNLLCYLPQRFIYSRFNLDTTGCMGIFCTVGSSYTKKGPRKMRKTHFYQLLEQLRQYECNKTQINTVCVTAGSKTNGEKWIKNRLSSLVVTSMSLKAYHTWNTAQWCNRAERVCLHVNTLHGWMTSHRVAAESEQRSTH